MLIRSLKRAIDTRLSAFDAIVVWGAGSGGRYALDLMPPGVDYIVDSFSEETSLKGLPIRHPEALKSDDRHIVIVIASFAEREIENWCIDNGIKAPRIALRQFIGDVTDCRSELGSLKADLLVYYLDSWFDTFVTQPQVLVNVTYRICRALMPRRSFVARILFMPMRILHALTGAFFGVEIPIKVEAGPGLQFTHFGGIVLHEDVRIGSFCKIYQCVTLGTDKTGRSPWLGDYVTVWSNSIVIGGCRLGNHTQVAANAVVLGDLDVADVSLIGIPARPVRRPHRAVTSETIGSDVS